MRHLRKPVLALFLGWSLSACDCTPQIVPSEDAGQDAGEVLDAGHPLPDAGPPDAGPHDAGIPDAGPPTCSSCHGSSLNAAPPRDTQGRSEPGLRTVGAHQAHLGASLWHRDGQCSDCHVVPATTDAPGHIDPSPAEVVWSAVATANGVTASYDGGTCGTYCHGPTLHGGLNPDPLWTKSDSTQAYCGDCHGVPPPAPHQQNVGTDCSRCHPDAKPGLGFAEPQRHIDGVLDVKVDCVACHGGFDPVTGLADAIAAPPTDTAGRRSTTLRSVGAHRSHLGPSPWHKEVLCTECHVVPTLWSDVGHINLPPAELTFGPRATAQGATPAFNGTSCSNVYCHGGTIQGGRNQAPVWTVVAGKGLVGLGEVACGTCHSLPPTSAPHVAGSPLTGATGCGSCHGAVIDTSLRWVHPELHIDGVTEMN